MGGDNGIRHRMPTEERFCTYCGKPYLMVPGARAEFCSSTCTQKAWRARTMLAGTHGYVKGKWKRLKYV